MIFYIFGMIFQDVSKVYFLLAKYIILKDVKKNFSSSIFLKIKLKNIFLSQFF